MPRLKVLFALFKTHLKDRFDLFLLLLTLLFVLAFGGYFYFSNEQLRGSADNYNEILIQSEKHKSELLAVSKELEELKTQDQIKVNKELSENIKNLENTYQSSLTAYEKILDLKVKDPKVNYRALDTNFTKVLSLLAKKDYTQATSALAELNKQISDEEAKRVVVEVKLPENVPVKNDAPSSGYSRQTVDSPVGKFVVDIVSADMNSTRVIVDTAASEDCRDNCPVLPLGDYVSRNGAFAGINGAYFCPAEYPSCAGKTNSYDTLLMNKNKKYFNSDNNVYSTVPAVIFQGSSMRFVSQSSQWGRDTGIDSMIANHPLLLSDGNITFGGNSDPKQGSKGNRSFVGSTGSTAYIGVVRNATVAEAAHVLKAMGISSALNLDSGGSTALWSGGYKAGPGRNLPNAVLFVRK